MHWDSDVFYVFRFVLVWQQEGPFGREHAFQSAHVLGLTSALASVGVGVGGEFCTADGSAELTMLRPVPWKEGTCK